MDFEFPPLRHAIPSILSVLCGMVGMYFLHTMGVIVGVPAGFILGATIVWCLELRSQGSTVASKGVSTKVAARPSAKARS